MTDQQTDLRNRGDEYDADGHDESAAPDLDPDDYFTGVETDDGYADTGDMLGYAERGETGSSDDAWDALDDWDAYIAAARPSAPARTTQRWYRDPRWLFALIALAAAALVVATVLLVTGRGSGEIPTAPELTTRTPASTTSAPTSREASPRESATSSTTATSAPSTSEEPSVVDIPAPVESSVPVDDAPPQSPAPGQSKSPPGPRINVTRTPMSFSPGKH